MKKNYTTIGGGGWRYDKPPLPKESNKMGLKDQVLEDIEPSDAVETKDVEAAETEPTETEPTKAPKEKEPAGVDDGDGDTKGGYLLVKAVVENGPLDVKGTFTSAINAKEFLRENAEEGCQYAVFKQIGKTIKVNPVVKKFTLTEV